MPSSEINTNWDEIVDINIEITSSLKQVLPNAVVLPTIGNNDVEFYYQVPALDRK